MMQDRKVDLDTLRKLADDNDKLSEEERIAVNKAILFITAIRNESVSIAENFKCNIKDDLYDNKQLIIDYAKDTLLYHSCTKDVLKYLEDKLVILTKMDYDLLENPGEYILYYCSDIEKIYVLIPENDTGRVTIIIDTNPSLIYKWKKDRIPWEPDMK